MKAGAITIEINVVDKAMAELKRIAWTIQSIDGQWHPSYLKADKLYQQVRSEAEAALVTVEKNWS